MCDQWFSTQSGLGQHERHRHPVPRNEKRLKPAPQVKGKPGRSDHIWSQEEVAHLRELEVTFAGCKLRNKSIGRILKTKTPKQISDKRRLLANTPTEVKNTSEPTTGIDSHDSEAESVQENSDDEAQCHRASRKTPASFPKHQGVDDQLTQAEELLSARNDPDTLALGIGQVDSITDLLMRSRKRQNKHKRPQKDRAKKDKRPGSNTGAKNWWAAHKALFRATQLLYNSNRCQPTREIMGAPTSSACPLSKEELATCFREKLSVPNKKSNINKYAPYTGKVDDGSLMKPIEVEEVEAAIKGIDENSAGGSGGLKLQDIRTLHEQEWRRRAYAYVVSPEIRELMFHNGDLKFSSLETLLNRQVWAPTPVMKPFPSTNY
ncbi:hypothetical protein chiPu_0013032 [Chiloscyllium punctatum]|uniref:Uncharacterized protein n=1 Tax=Chiloscyllium punctatum TaxID=137246 RepID=A0A401SVY0_CHIPU|nr:hypothetical protein [Chiloscyllium punctatum]